MQTVESGRPFCVTTRAGSRLTLIPEREVIWAGPDGSKWARYGPWAFRTEDGQAARPTSLAYDSFLIATDDGEIEARPDDGWMGPE